MSTMWNGVQNMWMKEDDIDALEWKGQQYQLIGGRVGMTNGQVWKKSHMGMGDGDGGLCQNR
jgi:hypothetical protein